MDQDILQVKTFTAGGSAMEEIIGKVDAQVNAYMQHYDADLVHSIQPQLTAVNIDGVVHYQYTVLVTLRS